MKKMYSMVSGLGGGVSEATESEKSVRLSLD